MTERRHQPQTARRKITMQHTAILPCTELQPNEDAAGCARKNRTVRHGAAEQIPPTGAELSPESTGKSQVDGQGDANSDALSDDWLVKLVEVWPALVDDVKAEILSLAGLRPDDVDDFNDVTAT